jgi:hypothetical protein
VLAAAGTAAPGYPQKLWITLWTIHGLRRWDARAESEFLHWSNFDQLFFTFLINGL